jgi:Rad3-related DNA helicase
MATQNSTATNLTGPNIQSSAQANQSLQYYNNLSATNFSVSANTNDALVAFFEEYCPTKAAADNLAAAVEYTALAQNLNPLSVLADFRALPKNQLNTYLVAFLNITRIPTSVLGTSTGSKTNSFVSRSIIL